MLTSMIRFGYLMRLSYTELDHLLVLDVQHVLAQLDHLLGGLRRLERHPLDLLERGADAEKNHQSASSPFLLPSASTLMLKNIRHHHHF